VSFRPRPLSLILAATTVTAAVGIAQSGAATAHVDLLGPDLLGLSTSYIVTLDSGSPEIVAGLAAALGGDVGHVYENALQGFSVSLPTALLPTLLALPGVASIERDEILSISSTQSNPSYGLDRIDQRALPLSTSYTTNAQGSGVKAYILDTGIRLDHADFGGRAVSGFDAVDGGSADDCNGHGTHVAGTTGGTRYGVAKAATLVAVRVTSGVIAGVDWVTANHQPGEPAVANMSLGGGASAALDTAVKGAIADGVSFVVAAGNGGAGNGGGGLLGGLLGGAPDTSDACTGSPSRVAEVLTVGATDASDAKASFSNRGTCLDLFAPGTSIRSAWLTDAAATNTISGTSMAAPHVAGVAALYLSTNRGATPAQVAQQLTSTATPGVVQNAGTGSPNRLLFTNY
jgi:subtilisin family serine protease